jgi:hypothetical protein
MIPPDTEKLESMPHFFNKKLFAHPICLILEGIRAKNKIQG